MKHIKEVRTKADAVEWEGKLRTVIAKRKMRGKMNGGLLGLFGLAPDNMPELKGKVEKPLRANQNAS